MAFGQELSLRVLDWLLVIATSVIALVLLNVNPDFHSFSVVDLSISHGHRPEAKVSLLLLIILAVLAPVLAITIISLYPIRLSGGLPTSTQFRNLNSRLLGLGVCFATATVILNVKNLAGVPRPDFLERCKPDVDNIAAYTVGANYGISISDRWVMVRREICQAGWSDVNEGFRSFPSGYATIAFAGLWYLTLFLHAKLGIAGSYSSTRGAGSGETHGYEQSRVWNRHQPAENIGELDDLLLEDDVASATERPVTLQELPRRRPLPTFLLIAPYLSLGLAIFIAGTRYFDFRNHGFDVLAGAAAGIASASFSFRLYGEDARE